MEIICFALFDGNILFCNLLTYAFDIHFTGYYIFFYTFPFSFERNFYGLRSFIFEEWRKKNTLVFMGCTLRTLYVSCYIGVHTDIRRMVYLARKRYCSNQFQFSLHFNLQCFTWFIYKMKKKKKEQNCFCTFFTYLCRLLYVKSLTRINAKHVKRLARPVRNRPDTRNHSNFNRP